jgi:hypothetical protein
MSEIEQRLPRRVGTAAGGRRVFLRWKLILPLALVLAAVVVAAPLLFPRHSDVQTLTYSELVSAIGAGRVESVEIGSGDVVRGRFAGATVAAEAEFMTIYQPALAENLIQRAQEAGVAVSFERAPNTERYRVGSMVLLQVLLFAGIGYFIYMQTRGQSGGSTVGRLSESSTGFADVAGTQGAAEDLREVVDFLREPSAFAAVGAHVPKGVLLVGPPGTGKTLLARAVAGEAGVPFFHLSGSEVTGFIVGLGAQRVRKLFKKARSKGGVIFIDELDSLGSARGRNRSHNEDDRTLNQLLVEMDGFAPTEGVVVIGATNRPEDLDPALKRPGRFDRIVTVGLPTVDGREAILRLHADRRRIPARTGRRLHAPGQADTRAPVAPTWRTCSTRPRSSPSAPARISWSGGTSRLPATACCSARSASASGRPTVSGASSRSTRPATRWPAWSPARRMDCTRSRSSRAAMPWASRTSRPAATGTCTRRATSRRRSSRRSAGASRRNSSLAPTISPAARRATSCT